tara:strand:+ start:80 stop:448 length:369 start_codon:yes stop_codon:yes gene_type:complete
MKISKARLEQIIKEELQKEVNRVQPRRQIKSTKDRIRKTSKISSEMPSKEICREVTRLAEEYYEDAKYGMYDVMSQNALEKLILSPEKANPFGKSFPKIVTKCFTLEQKRKYLSDPTYEEKK